MPSGKPLYVPYILHFKNHGWQLVSANQGDGFGFWECLVRLPGMALGRMDEEALTLTSGHTDYVPLLIWNDWLSFPPNVECLLFRIIGIVMEIQVKLFSSLWFDFKLLISLCTLALSKWEIMKYFLGWRWFKLRSSQNFYFIDSSIVPHSECLWF